MSLQQTGNTLNDTQFQSNQVFVPPSLQFKPVKQGLAARRVPVKWRAEQQTYSSNNNKLIRIILPNNALYDTRGGYLTFDVNLTVTGGTYKRVHTGIFSIFNRLRVLFSSTEVEDLRDYNRIYSALWEMINPTLTTSNLAMSLGFGTQADRDNAGGTTTSYACPMFSGVLNTELLPFDNVASGMVLELYLEDGTACIETDGTNPIITISNIVFHMERLELDAAYRSFIASYVRASGLTLGFTTWERFTQALPGGTIQNITINSKASSVNGILNFLILSTDLNNTLVNNKFLTWLPLSLQQYNVLINGTIFPDEPIDTISANRFEAYEIMARWLRAWKLSGFLPDPAPISTASFAIDRFVFILDFEPYPECTDIINPFTTLGNNGNIIIKLVFNGLIPPNYQLDSWVESFRQVTIESKGSVKVIQ